MATLTRTGAQVPLSISVSAYLSQRFIQPIPTKDGKVLRTVREAREYMLALPAGRASREQWQQTAKLLLDEAPVYALSQQIQLALLYDGKLDSRAMEAHE